MRDAREERLNPEVKVMATWMFEYGSEHRLRKAPRDACSVAKDSARREYTRVDLVESSEHHT